MAARLTIYDKRKRGQRGKAKPKDIALMQRNARALKLRVAGKSYAEIGEELGLRTTYAAELIAKEIDRTAKASFETAMKVRDLEVLRLDEMLAALWEQKADARTVDTILKIMERRSKLLGLDATSQVELRLTGLELETDEALARRAEQLAKLARQRDTNDEEGEVVTPKLGATNLEMSDNGEATEDPPELETSDEAEKVDAGEEKTSEEELEADEGEDE